MRGSLVSSLANLDHVDLLGHARAPVDRRLFSWPPCRKAQLAPSADLAASVSQTMNRAASHSGAQLHDASVGLRSLGSIGSIIAASPSQRYYLASASVFTAARVGQVPVGNFATADHTATGVTFPPPRSLSPQCCATQKGFAARLKYAIDSAPINLRYPASEINRQPLATQDIRAPRHDNIPDGRHRVLTHVEGGRPQILILLTTTTSSLASIWRACRSPAGPSAAAFGHARTCFPPCSAFAGL
jgi:hypothetical protein